ncbi:hypothetical protein [Methyloglobulus sp.]
MAQLPAIHPGHYPEKPPALSVAWHFSTVPLAVGCPIDQIDQIP